MTEPLPLFRQQAIAARSGIEGAVFVNRTRLSWALTAGCTLLLCIGLVAMAFVSLPRVQRAPAIVISSSPPSKISAPRAGRIVAIQVVEGQRVQVGDVIARISSAQDEEMVAREEIERLVSKQAEDLAGQQLRDQQGADEAELLNLEGELRAATNQKAMLRDQAADRREAMEIAEEEFRRIETVTARGFVSKSERNRRWLSLLQQRSDYREATGKISANEELIAKIQRKILRFHDDARLRQFASRNDQLAALARSRASRAGDRFIIRAPVAGVVSTIVAAPGAAVTPGTAIATIVAPASPVQAVLYVSSSSIGQVRKGQSVQLRFDSFPYQEYGSFSAMIVEVSPSVVLPGEGAQFFNLKDPSFKVVATINADRQERVRIIAGMTGEALIVTGKRGFFSSLFY